MLIPTPVMIFLTIQCMGLHHSRVKCFEIVILLISRISDIFRKFIVEFIHSLCEYSAAYNAMLLMSIL